MEKEEYRKLFELEDHLWWFKGMRDISLAILKRFIPDSQNLTVLDAGCGTGGMLPHLASLGQTVGIDISADALRFAGRRDNRLLANASVSRIPFPDHTFDLVTSFDVVYHRAVADDAGALAEMARVLRPGGTLLIRVPAYDWLRSRHDEAVHTRQRYGKLELKEKLEKAGFQLLYVTHANCLLFPIAAAKRLMEKFLSPQTQDSEVEPMAEPWNGLLYCVLRLEGFVLRYGKFPFGLSLVALARRRT